MAGARASEPMMTNAVLRTSRRHVIKSVCIDSSFAVSMISFFTV
jgi:hypothetical protein